MEEETIFQMDFIPQEIKYSCLSGFFFLTSSKNDLVIHFWLQNLEIETPLNADDQLSSCSEKAVLSSDHPVPVDLVLGTNEKIPRRFLCFIQRILYRSI